MKVYPGSTIETNNFAFEAKVNIGQNQPRPGGWLGGLWVGGWVGGWTS